jgi:hypothetical protein
MQLSMYSNTVLQDSETGTLYDGARVVEVWATAYRPRMPSDGSCGCRREQREGKNVLVLCARHAEQEDIAHYCLRPPYQASGRGKR